MFLRIIYATVVILIGIVGFQAFSLYQARSSAEKAAPEQIIGPEDATLDVVMFFDYQCPYCKDMYPTLMDALQKDRKARLVLRLLPAMGEESNRLARLAYAAGEQGKFMEMHTALIRHQGPLGTSALRRITQENEIDLERLLADSESEQIRNKTEENLRIAVKLGIYATPTLLARKVIYTPTGRMPEANDLLLLFAEARGEQPGV
ncbi:MAG: hypothetical protein EOM26_09685 [Alphaproteobacteria bacterium]|nr:hypothetical protein [Alphaproteobacteria bacterium]